MLDKALEFVKTLGAEGKTVLFVGTKPEAKEITKNMAPKLSEIVKRLVETYQPLRIYLFGSYARGDRRLLPRGVRRHRLAAALSPGTAGIGDHETGWHH